MSSGADLDAAAAAAYSTTGASWQFGPGRVYDRLAEEMLAHVPMAVDHATVVDIGAGTGAASRAATRAGAKQVVAVDVALGMLCFDQANRPYAVAADARALPFAAGMFDISISAFALNHLADSATALIEMARVTRSGGCIVATSYALDDDHPVKGVVDTVLREHGWLPPPWHEAIRTVVAAKLATAEGWHAAGRESGVDGRVEHVRVAFPELAASDLVAWRLGMAQHVPFLQRLPDSERSAISAAAVERLGDPAPLVRSILVFSAVR